MSDQSIAVAIVTGVFAYAAMGGLISGVWITIYPPSKDRWGTRESGASDIFLAGVGWPITLVCLTATAGHHIGIATLRMCREFLLIPEKPK